MSKALDLPDDENGEVLRRMLENGDNLAVPRNIDFSVVLPDELSAQRFAEHFQQLGYTVSVEEAETIPELPWDVVVVKHMVPTHLGITFFENELAAVAAAFGGRSDGWGCFAQT